MASSWVTPIRKPFDHFCRCNHTQNRDHPHSMAAKSLDTKAGMAQRKEKRVSSAGELFGDDFKSSRAIKGLISACRLAACSTRLAWQWLHGVPEPLLRYVEQSLQVLRSSFARLLSWYGRLGRWRAGATQKTLLDSRAPLATTPHLRQVCGGSTRITKTAAFASQPASQAGL